MAHHPRPPVRRVSLADVARAADVSKMTVSRVINRHPGVNARTVEQVQAILARLGYEVPAPDRDGRRRRSRSRIGLHQGRIAVLIPDTDLCALRTPLSGRLLTGIDRSLKVQRLQMLISGLPAERAIPHFIAPRHVDGVILRTGLHQDWLPQAVGASRVPAVWVFEAEDRHGVDEVLPDNAHIARLVAACFAAAACARVLVIRDVERHPAHEQRIRELRPLLAASGMPLVELAIHDLAPSTWTPHLRTVLAGTAGPAGLFLPGTGMVVLACAQAVAQLPGTPARFRIVAMSNDMDMLGGVPHPVANIDIQPEAIGEGAVALLLRRLEYPACPPRTVLVPPVLREYPDAGASPR